MKVVVQRVRSAKVLTDTDGVVGEIGAGLTALVGFTETDDIKTLTWVANKLTSLRIFNDENGKLNLSVGDKGGSVLVISNFTLYGNCLNSARPDFSRSAKSDIARPLYEKFVEILSEKIHVETGRFGEHMELALDVKGPITIIIEK